MGRWGKAAGAAALRQFRLGSPGRWGVKRVSDCLDVVERNFGRGARDCGRVQNAPLMREFCPASQLGTPAPWLCPPETIAASIFHQGDQIFLGQDLWEWSDGADPPAWSCLPFLAGGGPGPLPREPTGPGASISYPPCVPFLSGFSWQVCLAFLLREAINCLEPGGHGAPFISGGR